MEIVVVSLAFAAAVLCAGVMGYAIQRGATCTVAAIDELVSRRSASRLVSLLEAALWIGGGLVLAQALQVLPKMPAGYAIDAWTVIGGVLLGLGAHINGACVLGAVARFGSGEWTFVATPIGFYLGCLTVVPLFGARVPVELTQTAPILVASAWVALPAAGYALWRVASSRSGSREAPGQRWHRVLAARVWSPHAATTVIGMSFVAMLLLVGAWAYTDALAELARGMAASVGARMLLALALLAGAVLGGWTARRLRSERVSASQLLRCLVGGMLMGWGGLLLPGGNDALILVGMPLGWPYAWLAFAIMGLTVFVARLASPSIDRP